MTVAYYIQRIIFIILSVCSTCVIAKNALTFSDIDGYPVQVQHDHRELEGKHGRNRRTRRSPPRMAQSEETSYPSTAPSEHSFALVVEFTTENGNEPFFWELVKDPNDKVIADSDEYDTTGDHDNIEILYWCNCYYFRIDLLDNTFTSGNPSYSLQIDGEEFIGGDLSDIDGELYEEIGNCRYKSKSKSKKKGKSGKSKSKSKSKSKKGKSKSKSKSKKSKKGKSKSKSKKDKSKSKKSKKSKSKSVSPTLAPTPSATAISSSFPSMGPSGQTFQFRVDFESLGSDQFEWELRRVGADVIANSDNYYTQFPHFFEATLDSTQCYFFRIDLNGETFLEETVTYSLKVDGDTVASGDLADINDEFESDFFGSCNSLKPNDDKLVQTTVKKKNMKSKNDKIYEVRLEILVPYDNSDTAWQIEDALSREVVQSGSNYGNAATYLVDFDLRKSCYDFVMTESLSHSKVPQYILEVNNRIIFAGELTKETQKTRFGQFKCDRKDNIIV